ncbi:MAG: hypothetical protein KDK36_09100 [Leptospiraceae bacterium]|nr:hypothetical protein [Leptospiraceae bacterium]
MAIISFASSNQTQAKIDYSKMDKSFINLFNKFLDYIGAKKVEINSSKRYNNKGSYHDVGMALDIHSIQLNDGNTYYFTVRVNTYSNKSDDWFFTKFKNFFNGYHIEYISPANILTSYLKKDNIYRNNTLAEKKQILVNMEKQKLPYEINRNHLHHLHIAFNPYSKKKTVTNNKSNSIIPLLILAGGGFFLWEKRSKLLEN